MNHRHSLVFVIHLMPAVLALSQARLPTRINVGQKLTKSLPFFAIHRVLFRRASAHIYSDLIREPAHFLVSYLGCLLSLAREAF